MADEKKNDTHKVTPDTGKPVTPGAAKAQGIKDAAKEASGTAGRTPEPKGSFDTLDERDKADSERELSEQRELQRNRSDEASNQRFNRGEEGTRGKKQLSKAEQEEQQENFVAGFNFDMYALSELYANMRDGNYWSAFRLVVDILHANIHPPVTGVRNRNMPASPQVPVRMSEVEDLKMKLEECCEDLKREHGNSLRTGVKEAPRASRERNVEAINFAGLIAMIEMVITLVDRFTKR